MTSAPVGRDLRKHSRGRVDLPVLVSDSANRVHGAIELDAADISRDGAFLRSDLLFEIGEILNLEIQLPGLAQARVRARGRVVRVSRADDAPGMGIEFVDLPREDQTAIQSAIDDAPREAGDEAGDETGDDDR